MRLATRFLLLVLGLVVAGPGLSAQGRPPSPTQEALLQTNAIRFEAMIGHDLRTLDTLLAPELSYIHSDGVLESKAEFLATLKEGRLHYQAIEPDEPEVRVYGEAGVVTGRSRMQVKVGAEVVRLMIRFTALYRREGTRWVLAAWQATRVPGP
jgi:hypothetical protein